jgi:hypothetical protein
MKTKKLIKKPNKLIKKTKRIQKGGLFFESKKSKESKQMLINDIKENFQDSEILKKKNIDYDKASAYIFFFESLSKEELDFVSIKDLERIDNYLKDLYVIDKNQYKTDIDILSILNLFKTKLQEPLIIKIKKEIDKDKLIKQKKEETKWKEFLTALSYDQLKGIKSDNKLRMQLDLLLGRLNNENKPKEGPRQDNKNTKEKTTLLIYKPTSFLYFDTTLPDIIYLKKYPIENLFVIEDELKKIDTQLPKNIYLKKYLIENLFVIGDELKYIINELFIQEYNINSDCILPSIYVGFDFDKKNNKDVGFVFQSQTDGDSGIQILEEYINKQYRSTKKSKFGLLIEKIPSPEIKVLLKSLVEAYMFMIRDVNKYLSQIIVKLPLVIEEYIKIFTYIMNINIFLCQILYHHLKIKDYKHLDNYDDIQKIFTLIEDSKISYDSYKYMLDLLLVEFKRIMPKSKSSIQEQIRNNTSNNDNKQQNSTTILKFDSQEIVYFKKIKNLYDTYIILKTATKKFKVKNLKEKRHNDNTHSTESVSTSGSVSSIINLNYNNLSPNAVLRRNPDIFTTSKDTQIFEEV